METGIYIRVKREGGYFAVDIGDPDLEYESLALWLASKDEEYLMRLVMMLLGRGQEEGE